MCLCVLPGAYRSQRRVVPSPGAVVSQPPDMAAWELNSGPLQDEFRLLTTDHHPWTPFLVFQSVWLTMIRKAILYTASVSFLNLTGHRAAVKTQNWLLFCLVLFTQTFRKWYHCVWLPPLPQKHTHTNSVIPLPQAPKCYNYRHVPPCLTFEFYP